MQKKDIIEALNKIFIPLGFKKKGNNWIYNNGIIVKVLNLQKSSFGNFFYINYGYILNSIPLGNRLMHISKGFSSKHNCDQKKIMDLLNFEFGISDEIRLVELTQLIEDEIVAEFISINTEEDILIDLEKRNQNAIPLIIKKHFNLPCD